jgi:predicted ester cyclase
MQQRQTLDQALQAFEHFGDPWEEAWNSHDLDALETMVTEDVTWEDPAMLGKTVHGRSEFREFSEAFFAAFPNVRVEGLGTPYLSLEGTGFGLRTRMTGTFSGELVPWGSDSPLAPNGRRFDVDCVELYELRDGLVSHWTLSYDLLGMSRQLGLLG